MKCKRVLALIFFLLLIFSLSACKGKKNTEDTQESTTSFSNTIIEGGTENAFATQSDTVYGTSEVYVPQSSQFANPVTTNPVTQATNPVTTVAYDDPANWSVARIVEEYKNAATKSNSSAKSTMKITLKDINVNNGEYDKAMSFVKPIIGKFIESSSSESTGITGGFQNLVAQDVSSARAYKSGNNTVIEMTMVEQTSGPKEDANSGSVGHAITAVGDINTVVNDLTEMGLPLELSEQDTKIYYTNPKVMVTINENGEIISGTWSYTVEICMDNMTAFGQKVEKASITMDNTITV